MWQFTLQVSIRFDSNEEYKLKSAEVKATTVDKSEKIQKKIEINGIEKSYLFRAFPDQRRNTEIARKRILENKLAIGHRHE